MTGNSSRKTSTFRSAFASPAQSIYEINAVKPLTFKQACYGLSSLENSKYKDVIACNRPGLDRMNVTICRVTYQVTSAFAPGSRAYETMIQNRATKSACTRHVGEQS